MKKYITLVAALLVTVSFTSCKKDCDCPTKTARVETTITNHETEVSSVDDTMFTKDMPEDKTAVRKTSVRKKVYPKAQKSQSYLSNPAPDGTDAENHDDDYYTRNDTMHRPTGTSIK